MNSLGKASERKQGRVRRQSGVLVGAAAALLGAALATSWGCATGAPPGADTLHQAIKGGSYDANDPSVFLLVAHQNMSTAECTATLLAPNLLLTARHCVSQGSEQPVLCGAASLGTPYDVSVFIATNDPAPSDNSRV